MLIPRPETELLIDFAQEACPLSRLACHARKSFYSSESYPAHQAPKSSGTLSNAFRHSGTTAGHLMGHGLIWDLAVVLLP